MEPSSLYFWRYSIGTLNHFVYKKNKKIIKNGLFNFSECNNLKSCQILFEYPKITNFHQSTLQSVQHTTPSVLTIYSVEKVHTKKRKEDGVCVCVHGRPK